MCISSQSIRIDIQLFAVPGLIITVTRIAVIHVRAFHIFKRTFQATGGTSLQGQSGQYVPVEFHLAVYGVAVVLLCQLVGCEIGVVIPGIVIVCLTGSFRVRTVQML